jgi:hypothetical protein
LSDAFFSSKFDTIKYFSYHGSFLPMGALRCDSSGDGELVSQIERIVAYLIAVRRTRARDRPALTAVTGNGQSLIH